jgi:two-component system secretion response regulator SsrB
MNLAIVEQNKLYREGLKTLLNQTPDFRVVFDTDNNSDFLQFLKTNSTDIVFLDFECIENHCSEKLSEFITLHPETKIIILTHSLEICRYENIIQTLCLDVMLKNSCKKDFDKHIREIANNTKQIN